jgi:uncharacterized UPF0146 family protein
MEFSAVVLPMPLNPISVNVSAVDINPCPLISAEEGKRCLTDDACNGLRPVYPYRIN